MFNGKDYALLLDLLVRLKHENKCADCDEDLDVWIEKITKYIGDCIDYSDEISR